MSESGRKHEEASAQERLILRAREGDQAASEALAKIFLPILFRYFRSAWKLSPLEAEEMTQDTFIEAWSSLHRFAPETWRAWLITIARRVAWKSLRNKAKRPHISIHEGDEEGDPPAFESPLPSQEELVAMRQEYQQMKAYVSCLRVEYREILHLHYMEEMSTDAISQSLDLPHGTVKTWLQRARKELKQQWKSLNEAVA